MTDTAPIISSEMNDKLEQIVVRYENALASPNRHVELIAVHTELELLRAEHEKRFHAHVSSRKPRGLRDAIRESVEESVILELEIDIQEHLGLHGPHGPGCTCPKVVH